MPLPCGIEWQYSSLTNCREHFQTCWVLYPDVKYFAPILSFGYWHCQHLIWYFFFPEATAFFPFILWVRGCRALNEHLYDLETSIASAYSTVCCFPYLFLILEPSFLEGRNQTWIIVLSLILARGTVIVAMIISNSLYGMIRFGNLSRQICYNAQNYNYHKYLYCWDNKLSCNL